MKLVLTIALVMFICIVAGTTLLYIGTKVVEDGLNKLFGDPE